MSLAAWLEVVQWAAIIVLVIAVTILGSAHEQLVALLDGYFANRSRSFERHNPPPHTHEPAAGKPSEGTVAEGEWRI